MKPIKPILGACMLCVLLASPAMSELTPGDLDKIRLIVNESEKRVKDDIGALKVEVATLSGRVDGIDKMMTWLMVLIVVAVGIPQIIMTWRSRSERALERRMEAMAQELETLKQQRIARP